MLAIKVTKVNLQTHIRPELWRAVSSTYESGNYSHAILDAMHYLSDVLREKTGLDGDGVTLVGLALGGNNPKLKINKLQTESERNEQAGFADILRGMYRAIRNPRSHEIIKDSSATAESVIVFINYLLEILAASEEHFTIPKFLDRVFDISFVESDRYAQLLVSEIPENKRLDTLIEIYRDKNRGNGKKLPYIVKAILNLLSYDEIKDFLSVVSEEFKRTQFEIDIRLAIQILPAHYWLQVEEIAMLRVEGIIIDSIKEGSVNGTKIRGTLGTWATHLIESFRTRDEIISVLLSKLCGNNEAERLYVMNYFLTTLPKLILDNQQKAVILKGLCKAVRRNEKKAIAQLCNHIQELPEDWVKFIVDELSEFTNPENPKLYLSDGTPFLHQMIDVDLDEIPF